MNYSELVISILTNVLFISIFIVLFFFSYGSYIEKKIVINQMDFLSLNIVDILKHFGESNVNQIRKSLSQMSTPNLVKEDKAAADSNSKILQKAMIANVFLVCVIGMIVGGIYYYNKSRNVNINMTTILVQNLIILFFVALVEMYFLTFIAGRFISIDPNRVKYKILENIDKKLKV